MAPRREAEGPRRGGHPVADHRRLPRALHERRPLRRRLVRDARRSTRTSTRSPPTIFDNPAYAQGVAKGTDPACYAQNIAEQNATMDKSDPFWQARDLVPRAQRHRRPDAVVARLPRRQHEARQLPRRLGDARPARTAPGSASTTHVRPQDKRRTTRRLDHRPQGLHRRGDALDRPLRQGRRDAPRSRRTRPSRSRTAACSATAPRRRGRRPTASAARSRSTPGTHTDAPGQRRAHRPRATASGRSPRRSRTTSTWPACRG